MSKTAIVLGATGLTGGYLLDRLLTSDEYSKIKVFSRRPCGKQHPKLEEIICNLQALHEQCDAFYAHDVFCCIGTTKKKTPDRQTYIAIDYGIPLRAAKLAEQNGAATFSVISALGADAKSRIFYNRTKGQMEQGVLACRIPTILIYRPALIVGERQERRLAENIGILLFALLRLLPVKKLSNYRPIHGNDLANALYGGVKHKTGRQILFRSDFSRQ